MEQLQELIAKISNLSKNELRLLRFRYPQKGLLQAYRQVRGDESGDKLLQAVAQECKLEFLPGEKIQLDSRLNSTLGDEISRLGFALKAFPLATTQSDVTVLAVSDPLDSLTKQVFQTLLGKPVMPVLVREDELLEALRFAIPSGSRGSKVLRAIEVPEGEATHVADGLKALVEKVLELSARELHVEILGANTIGSIKQTFDREAPVEVRLTPEELIGAVFARSHIENTTDGIIRGRMHLAMLPTGVDLEFEYNSDHKSSQGEKGRKIVFSNFSVKDEIDPVFWSSEHQTSAKKFLETLTKTPGLYLGAFPDLDNQHQALAAIQRLCPELYVLKQIQDLSSDPHMAKRLSYSRVILPLKANGIPQLLKYLEKAPAPLRAVIRGLFSYAELPRPCSFCSEKLDSPAETLALVPEGLHARLKQLSYPRGCPVCRASGYLGSTSLLAFAGLEGVFGEAFRAGKTTSELLPLLKAEDWLPISELALEQVVLGKAVLESVATTFLGKQVPTTRPLLGRFNATLSPLEESPLRRKDAKPKSQVEFHSVVLQTKGDLLAAREALLNSEREGLFESNSSAPTPPKPSAPPGVPSSPPASPKPTSGHAYHSVVLDLDSDLAAMRAKLLEEDD